MEEADHDLVTSTGSSTAAQQWHAAQRALINQGRLDEAMKMDIDDIRRLFGNKYDDHIAEMVESMKVNPRLQDLLTQRGWTIDYNLLK
jgi:hypothetical protein